VIKWWYSTKLFKEESAVRTTAFDVAVLCRPIDDREFEEVWGANKDDSGVWTFPDGSRLKALYKPERAFANADMTGYLGMCYFELLD
jgi:hypothetical protein